MALVEPSLNIAIAAVLNRMSQSWDVTAELTGMIQENKNLQIDILVQSPNRSPLVIENEYLPASTVENDAKSRLGKTLSTDGSIVTEAVVIRSPTSLSDCKSVAEAEILIQSIEFEYALLRVTYNPKPDGTEQFDINRIPHSPSHFLRGPITSFANFLANASLSAYALQRSIDVLDTGVQDSIGILKGITDTSETLKKQLAELLMQAFTDKDIVQGLGIASTMVINATLFQQKLASRIPDVLSLAQMKGRGLLNQAGLIAQWKKILSINYYPIYSIASEVLLAIDDPYIAARFIEKLFSTTQNLIDLGVADTHDLCGVVFQRFMTERKFLASFYTRPESATLLAHLAVPELEWSNRSVYERFKFADYACGTGTLVHSVYQRIAQLHEFAGGAPVASHAHMMEENITAADIIPSAAHLTATLLSSVYPEETYSYSRVVVPQYGAVDDAQSVSLGSLELLDNEGIFRVLYPKSADMTGIGPKGLESMTYELVVEEQSQDLIIMNPPFTRAMSDWYESAIGTWRPFNVLGNSKQTQERMHKREKQLTRRLKCYNGYQSMPSAFCGVADLMLKNGGIFAFVLPTTSLQGVSWRKFRDMLATEYINVIVVGIAGKNAKECAWSADTSLAEVLIIARKRTEEERGYIEDLRSTLVNLRRRPANTMIAAEIAQEIKRQVTEGILRTMEDGPWGGTPLVVGGESVGEMLTIPASEEPCQTLGIRDVALAQTAFRLSHGEIWFPQSKGPIRHNLSILTIREFATIGFAANNIANNENKAFQRTEISAVPDYPMVWVNRTELQRSLLLEPDQEGRIIPGKEEEAFKIWERRSNALIAAEVAFSSQSLICGYSKRPVIGGRAWPNIQLASELHEKAFVLWGNTSLGALSYWYYSSRQQVRRGIVTVTSLGQIPWLNPNDLSTDTLQQSSNLFDEFSNRRFLPLAHLSEDRVRKELDHRFLIDTLKLSDQILDSLDLVRQKWTAEPSIAN
ncbi:hypothetical protein C6500_00225 [Candidatus Poribacteria bacterium]|nr:MAG: hypothetical protein C6500_00225 [Candidatus Poribacteria bacterium]